MISSPGCEPWAGGFTKHCSLAGDGEYLIITILHDTLLTYRILVRASELEDPKTFRVLLGKSR